MILDSIFGRDNFRNSIGWQKNDNRAKGSQHKPKKWGTQYDTLLFYTKSNQARVAPTRPCTSDEIHEEFPNVDQAGRRYKTGIPLWRQPSMGARPNLCYTWRGFTNPHPSGWRLSKERMEEELSSLFRYGTNEITTTFFSYVLVGKFVYFPRAHVLIGKLTSHKRTGSL